MIFNYSNLIEIIFNDIKDGNAKQLEKRVFDSCLKEPFESTLLDFSGHNLRKYENQTIKDLLSSKYKSDKELFTTLYDKIISDIDTLIECIATFIKEDMSLIDIQTKLLNKPSIFSMFQIHEEYCFVCGCRTNYFMGDGIISKDSFLNSDHPLWENLLPIEKKIYSMHFSENKNHACSVPDGVQSYSYEIDLDDETLLVGDNIISVYPRLYMEAENYISEQSGYRNDINSELGCKYNQEFWHTKNVVYIQTGNTDPFICLDKESGSIAAIDNHAWKNKKLYQFPIDISNMVKKTSVTTDVWSVQMMTLKEFTKICEQEGKNVQSALEKARAKSITIKPGKYKVTNFNAHRYSDEPVFFTMSQI